MSAIKVIFFAKVSNNCIKMEEEEQILTCIFPIRSENKTKPEMAMNTANKFSHT